MKHGYLLQKRSVIKCVTVCEYKGRITYTQFLVFFWGSSAHDHYSIPKNYYKKLYFMYKK